MPRITDLDEVLVHARGVFLNPLHSAAHVHTTGRTAPALPLALSMCLPRVEAWLLEVQHKQASPRTQVDPPGMEQCLLIQRVELPRKLVSKAQLPHVVAHLHAGKMGTRIIHE